MTIKYGVLNLYTNIIKEREKSKMRLIVEIYKFGLINNINRVPFVLYQFLFTLGMAIIFLHLDGIE